MIRLFVEADLAAGGEVPLAAAQTHYLTGVMRLGAGDEILVFNGRHGEWRAALARRSKSEWALEPTVLSRPQAPKPDLELLAALIRRPRLETVVEKAAELGARRVRLLITERARPGGANLARLNSIAIEAAEQTGRTEVPQVLAPMPLAALIGEWSGERRLMFCDEADEAPPVLEALRHLPRGEAWSILIGPEGGFSSAERARVRAAPGAVAVGLGPRVLRADTAAIAAMSLWQARLGDWSGDWPGS
jgi:16S rRNA (uracil1498-N3)-methyltransferase